MNRNELQNTLAELRAELAQLPADAPGRERLAQLMARIDAQLDEQRESEPQDSFLHGVNEAAAEFEVEHPRTAGLLRRFVNTLSSMGI
jgi:predicted transcriptional regulator